MTKQELLTLINTNINDNVSGEITAKDIRDVLEAIVSTPSGAGLTPEQAAILGFLHVTKSFDADVVQDNLTVAFNRLKGLSYAKGIPADTVLDNKTDHTSSAYPIRLQNPQEIDKMSMEELLQSNELITIGNALGIEVALKSLVEDKIYEITQEVAGKVAKETGKALSKNDYTDADKAKVGSALQTHQDISNLVAKVAGKALSKNDYTDADKAKVGSALQSHQDITAYAKTADMNTELAKKLGKDVIPALPTTDGVYQLTIASGKATWTVKA